MDAVRVLASTKRGHVEKQEHSHTLKLLLVILLSGVIMGTDPGDAFAEIDGAVLIKNVD